MIELIANIEPKKQAALILETLESAPKAQLDSNQAKRLLENLSAMEKNLLDFYENQSEFKVKHIKQTLKTLKGFYQKQLKQTLKNRAFNLKNTSESLKANHAPSTKDIINPMQKQKHAVKRDERPRLA